MYSLSKSASVIAIHGSKVQSYIWKCLLHLEIFICFKFIVRYFFPLFLLIGLMSNSTNSFLRFTPRYSKAD